MILQAIGKNGLLLGLFAAIATLALSGTYLATRDDINTQKRAAEARALEEVVAADMHDNNLLDAAFSVDNADLLGLKTPAMAYRAMSGGNVSAVILPVNAPDGYSGNIQLIVGIDKDSRITGVRAIAHKETPGLGDKVDARKSDWIHDFKGRSLMDPTEEQWGVQKDGGVFDQFTGATITPRAVIASIKRSLVYFEQHRTELLQLRPELEN